MTKPRKPKPATEGEKIVMRELNSVLLPHEQYSLAGFRDKEVPWHNNIARAIDAAIARAKKGKK